jgi:beta-lactam-binding protein with PASTA domain
MSNARSVTVKFTKLVCIVPKVRGKTVRAATRALMKAHCKVGTVTRKYSKVKKGRVASQKPKSGRRRRLGAKVDLAVSKGTKP